jgi:glutaredoxin
MRATLVVASLLLLLAFGVVQTRRGGDGDGFVASWLQPAEVPQASPASPADPPEPETSPPEPQPGSSGAGGSAGPAGEPPRVLAAGDLSVLESEDREPMVRYFDAGGSLHMVRGLDAVPSQHRADAVVVGSGNVNVVSVPAPTAVAFRDWQPQANPNRSNVVLFSAPWCGACKRAKRHLDAKGVAYRERDIDRDASAKQELRRILGRVAIPLLDVNGRYISGFRPDVYDRALGTG